MAEVFLAKEPLADGLAKILVIKKIHRALADTAQFQKMFEDEAKVAVVLNHPNVVQTFGYGVIDDTYYLAMEHVEGVDLLQLLNQAADAGVRIPFGLSAYLGQQMAKALDYAHRKTDEHGELLGIVHRDVSPQNVLVSFDGMVKLVDFGIARGRHTRDDDGVGVIKGKFAYMSPEQASGAPVDARSDIFSAGIVLWEMVCGRPLFAHLTGNDALALVRADVPHPRDIDPGVPAGLEKIILRALALRPDDRFQTARDLHQSLGHFFFELSAREGKIYESSAMARFIAQVVPRAGHVEPEAPLHDNGRRHTPPPSEPAFSALRTQHTEAVPLVDAPLRLPQREQRSVVVVHAQLTGFASLRRELGDGQARMALLEFLRLGETLARRQGAEVLRLDERGLVLVVGVPIGTEQDPERALQLGRALIEAWESVAQSLPATPGLDSGRSSGLSVGVQRGTALVPRVVREAATQSGLVECELLGPTGEIAARLVEEAMPGEILVGGGVYRATRRHFRFEELESLSLTPPPPPPSEPDSAESVADADDENGAIPPALLATHQRPDPADTSAVRARVYRLLGPRARSEPRTVEPTRIIGRAHEVAQLAAAFARVELHARPHHLLLIGEAGIGKRTIVEAFLKQLDEGRHLVVRAMARPSQLHTPYALVADLVRDLLGVSEEAEPREVKRRLESAMRLVFAATETAEVRHAIEALAPVLGVKVTGAAELEPAERRHRLLTALHRLEGRLAEGRTLVVVLEDLHWVDAQSLDLVSELVRDPGGPRVLGLATARPDARILELAEGRPVEAVLVGELSIDERRALVLSRLLDRDADALAAQIVDRAGGNPFFIVEILDALVERGVLVEEPGSRKLRWVRRDEPIVVPTSVEALVASRIDQLPEEERDVIRHAALLGRLFRVDDLAALRGAPARAELARLASRGFIVPTSRVDTSAEGGGIAASYAFRNLITREVAYGGLSPDTRALLHSVAADRLRRSPGFRPGADHARLAEHLEAAGDRTAAGHALVEAGRFARDIDGASAFALLGRALELLPTAPPDDSENESEASAIVDNRYEAHRHRELLLRGWARRRGQLRELLAMRKLAEAGGRLDRQVEAACRRALLYFDLGKWSPARRELDRALALAQSATGDAVEEVRRGHAESLSLLALLSLELGQTAEALTLTKEALALLGPALDAPTLFGRAQVLSVVGRLHARVGRLQEAVAAYAEALAIHRRLGARRLEAGTLNNLGWAYAGLGAYEEALVHYKRSLKLGQELGERRGLGVKLSNIGQTYSDIGDYAQARRYLDKALELQDALGDEAGSADSLLARGQLLLRQKCAADARADLDEGMARAVRLHNRHQEIRALVLLAEVQVAAGNGCKGGLELARAAIRLAREAGLVNCEAHAVSAEASCLPCEGQGP